MAEAGERLGLLLVRAGIITERQLNDALEVHKATGSPLGRVLVDLGYASQGAILSVMARQIGVPYIDFSQQKPDPAAIAVVPKDLANRYTLMPVEFDEEGRLVVAMADPHNVLALDDLRIITGYEIKPGISTKDDIVAAINEYYRVAEQIDVDATAAEEEELDLSQLTELVDEAPIVKLVNYIINKAVADRASDIHIEPQEKDLRVRYRIDGVLHEMMRSPKSTQQAIISRFKIMSDMDIAESRKPQDGHTALTIGGHKMDFRVSTLPTVYGERVVLRILRKDNIMLRLEDLGFLPQSLKRFESSFRKPYGAILVTGPTGSGKSTTLYAAVNVLNEPSRHILTAEDPVEYRLPGVNQVQTNPKAGLTFARALRSFLRCSPDIILVGEIRDQETAKIAIESALTGHLVLSTLHTNDAPGAITRLIEMGVEPFLVASAVDCVLAQRLARRLCKDCKEEYAPPKQALIDAGFPEDDLPERVYRAVGCKKCGGTGYRGRMGIHEVMLVSEEISDLTVKEATAEKIRQVAIEQGMLTLRQDGLEKVRMGLTSLEEIARVVV
ncbi:Flp pilus assembly complex ATPase component TadA [Coriobacteriia bacterium Es71-Z0120]|uniref:GspE/PulE family protein n=1 Tax=Parvivirga hydrogeniphila TaxID=2939460 RepID=UPI002260D218|nr:ATPase, T2SS/T4P/T4SS family [Parvivirga hydrogeniphila]MCL4079157.1 Flp pilus assembly complex ATPase component TadA [Parvivirga hydrogeniphila]